MNRGYIKLIMIMKRVSYTFPDKLKEHYPFPQIIRYPDRNLADKFLTIYK